MSKFQLILVISLFLLLISGCSRYPNTNPTNEDFSAIIVQDIVYEIAQGNLDKFEVIHKFGAGTLTTTMQPISQSGFYQVPTSPTSLEFVSDDVDDTYLGTGARQITGQCINSSWESQTFIINTSGTTPVLLPFDCLRVYRWFVSSSGSYANQIVGSHEGELTLREVGGGQIWAIIPNSPFAVGQSEIGVFTIPDGKTGYLLSKHMFTDTSKTADIFFYKRCGADDILTPYIGTMNLVEREIGLTGGHSISYAIPKGPFIGPCDVGFMGKVSVGTADASVEFELVLVDTE